MPFVTQSQIKSWRKCKRQHYNRYVLKIGRKLPPLPLIRGTILHEMIDARASGKKDPMQILERYEVKYRRLLRAEKEIYGDLIDDCKAIFLAYCKHWADEDLVYEFTEIPAFTDLTSNIRYGATIDKIAKDKKGRRWLMDHKSHKNFPGEGQRMSDIQLVLYVWAWNRWNKDYQVSGIIWDYMRTKRPSVPELLKDGTRLSKAKIDTDYSTYMRAIKRHNLNPKDYADILDTLEKQKSPFFERVYLPNPSPALIESIVKDAHDDAVMIEALGKTLKTRNLSRDCDWCEYQALCRAEIRGLDADYVRKAEYEHKEPREYYARMEED